MSVLPFYERVAVSMRCCRFYERVAVSMSVLPFL
jgi:hypothetical protein